MKVKCISANLVLTAQGENKSMHYRFIPVGGIECKPGDAWLESAVGVYTEADKSPFTVGKEYVLQTQILEANVIEVEKPGA